MKKTAHQAITTLLIKKDHKNLVFQVVGVVQAVTLVGIFKKMIVNSEKNAASVTNAGTVAREITEVTNAQKNREDREVKNQKID